MWTEYASIFFHFQSNQAIWNENELRIQCKHQKTWYQWQCQTLDLATVWRKIHLRGWILIVFSIRITYYSYSYLGTILNPNIIRIRIRPNICARILFVFVFAHSEKTNIIRIRIRSIFWCRILIVFVFGQKNSIRSPLP